MGSYNQSHDFRVIFTARSVLRLIINRGSQLLAQNLTINILNRNIPILSTNNTLISILPESVQHATSHAGGVDNSKATQKKQNAAKNLQEA